MGGWVEEDEAVRMRCCGFSRGGWVGRWRCCRTYGEVARVRVRVEGNPRLTCVASKAPAGEGDAPAFLWPLEKGQPSSISSSSSSSSYPHGLMAPLPINPHAL